MMNKQQTQEAIAEVKSLIAKFESNGDVADLADAAHNTYGMGFEFTSTLHEVHDAIADLEARMELREYNAPVLMTTTYTARNELTWTADGDFFVAEVIVDSIFVGGKWQLIVSANGGEVFLESDRGWATSFGGFTSVANAKSAAQTALEAVAKVLTAYDGIEFVCDEFRQALANAEFAQRVVA